MSATAPQTLPLDVALQQAVAHHQAGRLQEAEQLYRAILQAQPDQADANHNMGVLAGQVGRQADGLPHLKAALEANPAQGQFWLSYAEALLATGQAGEALTVIQTAIQRGLDTPVALALRQKAEAALNEPANDEAPTTAELNKLVVLFNAGHYVELESRSRLLLAQYPTSGFAWKMLGASLQAQGKDALSALQKAAELLPDDDEAHGNLAVALQAISQSADAAASQAQATKPGYVEASNIQGKILHDSGTIIKDQNPTFNEPAHIPYARLWLVVACLVVYARFLNNPAIFDDINLIGNNAMLQAYGNSLVFDFTLRWFSHVTFGWTDKLMGANIFWHRVVNLTLHVFVVLTLYALLKRLFKSVLPAEDDAPHQAARIAFWGALIFAVHPVAVYGVGYLIERSIVMATLFAILALHAFDKGLNGDGRKWYFIACAWYFIAVFSKEHAVMLPLAMAAMIPLARRDYRALTRDLALPFLLFFGVALLLAMKTQGLLGTVYEPHAMAMMAKAASSEVQVATSVNPHYLSILFQGYLFFKYLLLWLVPNVGWMSIDMQQKFPTTLLQWPESVGFLIFAIYPIAAGLLLWRGGKRGLLGYALLFPWLMFPTEFYSVRIVESFTLYRSYLWMVALPIALPAILGKQTRRRENAVLAMVVVALVLLSWNRLNTFTSDIKVWDDVIAKFPEEKTSGMYRAYKNRGLFRVESTTKAMEDMDKGIEINPNDPGSYVNRGALKGSMKLYLDAYEDFNRAIEIDPNFSEAYANRGVAQIGLGNKDKGLSDFAYAITLQPENERYKSLLEQFRRR